VTPGLIAAVVAGALLGLAVALAVAAGTRRHPVLTEALAALDETVPPRPAEPATRFGRVLPALRALPVAVPDSDLELLGIGRDRYLIEAASSAAVCAACGPFLAVVFTVLDSGISPAFPTAVAIGGLLVGWTAHARRIRERADGARDELRSALVSYLQQVGLLRRGGAGVSTALTLPGRLLGDAAAA